MKKGEDYTGICIVFLCHDGNGNILLQKRGDNCRDENNRWDIGGGGIDFGDSIEETLKKEISEEYCTDVISYEFLGYRDVHREKDGRKTHWIALDFKVLVDKDKVKNGEPHKFSEIGWFTLDSLPTPLHSQLPTLFSLHKDKI
ncbi:MAG: RNA pyrophosphohydrolase [Candidatus Harrisonbacteria bacterium CG10_big_fil_rev_8_21_14_0_10_38_8]|uniref:RNA pyrophosphohydrolase n=1 Tax=Candidatus Harrisonbacteria bacterium CG10_big_fil_rev_8_21_14_0_10_38_8 TaxID=1974582 RepID=A0A2M6WJK0_9BACT|nr:MAG: RNA pyrophosphohydrolase [Candidatus Harrisonbacteria bacterium CG10_big_fil_rev_8_21_14_0_10_38_8]